MEFLSGYKTYIIAGLVGVVAVVHQLGYIDDAMAGTILTLLGGGGLATLRAGVASAEK
jgi:uncharacterized membrane protein